MDMTILFLVTLGLFLIIQLIQSLRLSVQRKKFDELLAQYNGLKELHHKCTLGVAADVAVSAARQDAALAWCTAHRYMNVARAQMRGMQRMARRVKRLRKAEEALGQELAQARAEIVHGFYEEEMPQFKQGGVAHELTAPVTAAQCAWWVHRIRELEDGVPIPQRVRDAVSPPPPARLVELLKS